MIRVSIIDDHPMTVVGLQKTLERAHDIIVVAAVTDVGHLQPGCAVDVAIVGIDCDDPLPMVADLAASTRVIIMSGGAPRPFVDACIRLGAVRHLDKRLPLERFTDAVRAVAVGNDARSRAGYVPAPDRSSLNQLSPREREVLGYIADGYTHEQAARRIGVSRHTVDTYIKRVRSKLSVGNKAELTKAAFGGFGQSASAAVGGDRV